MIRDANGLAVITSDGDPAVRDQRITDSHG